MELKRIPSTTDKILIKSQNEIQDVQAKIRNKFQEIWQKHRVNEDMKEYFGIISRNLDQSDADIHAFKSD